MFFSWMKSLIIYLLLSGLVMRLVPEKNYSRYISFFMGLVMIIILSRPIIYIFKLDKEDYLDRLERNVDEFLMVNSYNGTDSYAGEEVSYYELSFNEAVKYICENEGYDVRDVSVITDNDKNVLSCVVYINGDYDENIIKNLINDVYKIDFGSIYIVRR
ncbi:MAG: stage III sporulation protein AF [Lachnospiraceae bacterium]|nr:stage III sporulation protein AF [Lachnospiraceae bacterium]